MTQTVTQSRASTAAAQKRAAAARARRYRERKKQAGAPLAAAVDRAVAEAVAFVIKKNGVNIGIDPTRMLKLARLILEREGYSPAEAAKAVAERTVRPRDEHGWPDYVPTTAPGPVDRFRETASGPWTTPLDVVLKHISLI